MAERREQEQVIASQRVTGEPGAADQTVSTTEIDYGARLEDDLKKQ